MHSSRTLSFLILTVFALGLATPAAALPRYAARYGQKCLLCHQDPGGGGMRSAYATQFLVPGEMSWQRYETDEMEAIQPQLNDRVSIGADLRTLYTHSPDDDYEAGNSFFQMQGDLYLHLQLDDRFSASFDRGMSGNYEVYGIGYILPMGGYVKVGRFVPAYGWRFADHKQFVRDLLGFAPPGHSDVGLELGMFPGSDASLTFGLLNGAGGQVRDGDNRPAIALRGELRRRVGPLNMALGASYYRDEEFADGNPRRLTGPFAYLTWGAFSWVGEWDWQRREQEEAITSMVTSHEFGWQLRPGFDLRATYSFQDPDIDSLDGSQRKMGLGFDMLATPFVGVLLMLNRNDFETGGQFTASDYNQAELVVHFLY